MERTLFAVRYSRHFFLRALAAASLLLVLIQVSAQNSADGLRVAHLGDCPLQSGQVLHECRIGYRTFGRLNPAADNAVLLPTWLYGTSADLTGFFGNVPSAQQLVDTSRFFGIAVDALERWSFVVAVEHAGPAARPRLPAITTRDMVQAEYRLVTEVLHLQHLRAVVGLSMGGEQTFVWAVDHPHFFDLAVPILGTPRLTSYDLQVKRIMIESIVSDPDFKGGRYTSEPPLKLANLFGNLTVTSPEERNADTPLSGLNAFFAEAEAPLSIDANDRLAQLKAITHQDVIGSRSIAEAARLQLLAFW